MIGFIKGNLAQVNSDNVIVNVGGIGYIINLTKIHIQNLPPINSEVFFYTHLIHKEDNMQLFGFDTYEKKELFILLISVSGIGAKLALTILSELKISDIVIAILENKPEILKGVSGIGKKTAERIILELREKLKQWKYTILSEVEENNIKNKNWQESFMALQALGYTELEINKVFQHLSNKISSEATIEEIIKESLKWLSDL